MITEADEYFHVRNEDPYWNESAWFSLMIPERNLCGWVYFYHRPNMKYSVGGVALWDSSGEETYNCRFYNWGDTYPLKPGFDMFDFSLPNGLKVTCVEPLKTYRLQMASDGIELDLTWTSFMLPQESGFPEGGAQDWGRRHYEQGGRMAGSIQADGENFKVDCWSNRDRSWGPRNVGIEGYPRSGFPWCIASDKHAFNIFSVNDLPAREDPVFGAVDRVICGWYLRDGLVGALVSGERRVIERDADGRPLKTQVKATDEHGRLLEADGTCTNWINWHGYPFLFQWWSLAKWSFDGVTAWGEEQDFYPLQAGRRLIRSRK